MSGINVIEDGSLRATESGFNIKLRFKWYRSLPLSCLEYLHLSLDGRPVDPSALSFGINGHKYRPADMVDLVEEFWFITDPATLDVDLPGAVRPGESHRLEVAFALRVPYILIGPGRFLSNVNTQSTVQIAG